MPTRSEPSAKRQRKEELLSVLHLLMNSSAIGEFVNRIDNREFGCLMRCCKSFKTSLGIHVPDKINQLVELYTNKLQSSLIWSDEKLGLLFRMYCDKQITETQYWKAYNIFYSRERFDTLGKVLFNLSNRTSTGELIVSPSRQYMIGRFGRYVPNILFYIKNCRYPTPLDLLPPGENVALELAFRGYPLHIIETSWKLCTNSETNAYFSWTSLKKTDLYTTNQWCQRHPEYYNQFPSRLLSKLVNEPGNGSLLQIPGLITADLFVSYRETPYELDDLLRLGISAKEFAGVAHRSHIPRSVLIWLRKDNSNFLMDSSASELRKRCHWRKSSNNH